MKGADQIVNASSTSFSIRPVPGSRYVCMRLSFIGWSQANQGSFLHETRNARVFLALLLPPTQVTCAHLFDDAPPQKDGGLHCTHRICWNLQSARRRSVRLCLARLSAWSQKTVSLTPGVGLHRLSGIEPTSSSRSCGKNACPT